MSLSHPTCKVEWTSNFSAWTDISDDVLEFHLKRCDLTLGPWTFTLVLDNKEGKYSKTTFPAIDSETGLHKGFRFYVNDKLRGVFRAASCEGEFGYGRGDVYIVTGFGLGQESVNRDAIANLYQAWRGDDLIADQQSKIHTDGALVDISYTSPGTAPRTYLIVPDTGRPSYRDVIVYVAENIGYVAWFKSTEKPAPLQLFAKNDSAKQLNTILQSILFDQDNNILRCRQPRTTVPVFNHLILEQFKGAAVNFRAYIPTDQDAWTDLTEDGLVGVWIADSGVRSADASEKHTGDYSVKCDGTYTSPPNFYLVLANSGYGAAFNPDNEQVDTLFFQHKEPFDVINEHVAVSPRLELEDDASHVIYRDYSQADVWTGLSIPVGTGSAGWSGDTGTFNWNITKIRFKDTADHSAYPMDDPKMWVDLLYFFEAGQYDGTYLEDAASVSAHGRRDDEIPLPAAYPYVNTYRWGQQILDKLSQPHRVVSLTAVLDPALIKEDDDATAADVLPGWSVQLDIPRHKLNTVANGGIWWRILSTHEHWQGPPEGYTVDFELVATTTESPEDYSRISESQLFESIDPYMAKIRQLAKQQSVRATQTSKIIITESTEKHVRLHDRASVADHFGLDNPENVDDQSADAAEMQGTADPYPGGSPSLATDLVEELKRLRYQLDLIIGEAQWYQDPDNSLDSATTPTYVALKCTNLPDWTGLV